MSRYTLMAVTQEISARLGRTTGRGLAGNIRRHYPSWVAQSCIGLLLIANVINLGADLGSMGDVTHMLSWRPSLAVCHRFRIDLRRVAGVLTIHALCEGAEVADTRPLCLFRNSADCLYSLA